MKQKINTVGDQRFDKHHNDLMVGLIDNEFLAHHKYLWAGNSSSSWVVFGWVIESAGGLVARVNRSADSALIVNKRVGFENLQWRLASDPVISVTLPDNSVSYVEVNFADSTTQNETVSIWDPTANAGAGAEFTQTIGVIDEQVPTLVSQLGSFSGATNRLPLAIVTTAGGVISNVQDARNLLFSFQSNFAFGGPRSDKNIWSIKNMFDATTTIIKELKGTANWYDDAAHGISGLNILERFNYLMVDGGNFSWNSGTGVLAWDATIRIVAPNQAFTYTIAAGNVTLTAGQLAYVTLPAPGVTPGGALTPVVVSGGSFPLDTTNMRNYILAYRSTVSNAVYVGGQLELSNGETGQIGVGASTQLLHAIGVPDEATPNPPYTSTFNYLTTDGLTAAVSKLDSAVHVIQSLFSGPIYDQYTLVGAGGQAATTTMTLPSAGAYQVGANQLEIYVNGVKYQAGSGNDYLEIDGGGGVGTQIQMLPALAGNAKVEFRIQAGGAAFSAQFAPHWTKYTVLYSALAAASPTNNILLATLPAKTVVHGSIVKHSVAFGGGTISAYTVSVGPVGSLTLYTNGTLDVFQSVTDAHFLKYELPNNDIPAFSGSTNVQIAATSTGANLNAATAGSVDVWLLTSLLP